MKKIYNNAGFRFPWPKSESVSTVYDHHRLDAIFKEAFENNDPDRMREIHGMWQRHRGERYFEAHNLCIASQLYILSRRREDWELVPAALGELIDASSTEINRLRAEVDENFLVNIRSAFGWGAFASAVRGDHKTFAASAMRCLEMGSHIEPMAFYEAMALRDRRAMLLLSVDAIESLESDQQYYKKVIEIVASDRFYASLGVTDLVETGFEAAMPDELGAPAGGVQLRNFSWPMATNLNISTEAGAVDAMAKAAFFQADPDKLIAANLRWQEFKSYRWFHAYDLYMKSQIYLLTRTKADWEKAVRSFYSAIVAAGDPKFAGFLCVEGSARRAVQVSFAWAAFAAAVRGDETVFDQASARALEYGCEPVTIDFYRALCARNKAEIRRLGNEAIAQVIDYDEFYARVLQVASSDLFIASLADTSPLDEGLIVPTGVASSILAFKRAFADCLD
ncbi:MAG: hypothetical protein HRF49_08465 [bacterium]|jgi:hypothetical protein